MGNPNQYLKKLDWAGGALLRPVREATALAHRQGFDRPRILADLKALHAEPQQWADHPVYGVLAQALIAASQPDPSGVAPRLREHPVPCEVWGRERMDEATLAQMEMACRLPIAVRGAQMPDGHVGYGLPIGGVLATRNAVIPYGVGVDIACRMKLSILTEPAARLAGWRDRLKKALREETRFGMGAGFGRNGRREHPVMDDPDWDALPPRLRALKDKAWDQLGSSGSGNHFVEWGELALDHADLDLEAGRYLALLSHSGSRGLGAEIAQYFTRIAMDCTRLPREASQLAWLTLDSEPGQQYWLAMNLAGRYASANHALIHRHVLAAAKLTLAAEIENHHNFAWLEVHQGEQVVVHRKGATPAGRGVLGIIPGSMGDPGFIVRGRGMAASLESAAHGAGRRMSRSAAKRSLTKSQQRAYLEERGIELMAGGIDESPQVYKNIHSVMAAQSGLVDPIATFHPRIVLMAADGPAED